MVKKQGRNIFECGTTPLGQQQFYLILYRKLQLQFRFMKAQILRNIQYSGGQKIISQAIVKKKSNWLGIWRTRQMILFSNKICFFRSDWKTEEPRIQLFLSQIAKLESDDKDPTILIIFYVQGKYEVKFEHSGIMEQWNEIISKAIRTFKVKQSQFLTRNNIGQPIEARELPCVGFF